MLQGTIIGFVGTLLGYGMGLSLGLGVFGPLGPTGLWVGLVGGLAVAAVVLNLRFWRLTRVV